MAETTLVKIVRISTARISIMMTATVIAKPTMIEVRGGRQRSRAVLANRRVKVGVAMHLTSKVPCQARVTMTVRGQRPLITSYRSNKISTLASSPETTQTSWSSKALVMMVPRTSIETKWAGIVVRSSVNYRSSRMLIKTPKMKKLLNKRSRSLASFDETQPMEEKTFLDRI